MHFEPESFVLFILQLYTKESMIMPVQGKTDKRRFDKRHQNQPGNWEWGYSDICFYRFKL